MKIFLLTLFLIAQIYVNSKTYNCVFDQLYSNYRPELAPTDKVDQGITQHHHGRQLLVVSRTPMRITLDTTNFSTIITGANGAASTTTSHLNFILRAMQVTANFYQNRLQVTQLSRIYSPSNCFDFTTPINDQTNGIASSDLHIYVRYVTDKNIGYGATGISCKQYTGTSAPDSTLQAGRSTVGRIIFNTYTLLQSLGISNDAQLLTNRLFSSITATALHQTCHILGFNSALYSTFLNPNSADGSVYSSTVLNAGKLHPSRTAASKILTTPYVTAWTKSFFNCPSAVGMQLQNQDGSGSAGGSHWERVVMYDQLMTGTALGAQKGFSGLTFAILKDMGWYTVDDSWSDTTNYGYQLGCSFMTDACYESSVNPKYFCNYGTTSSISQCDTNFLGKAVCTNQTAFMADGCGILGQYFACVDPAQTDDGYKQYTLESYGTSSFCVASTFSNVAISSNIQSRCYPYVCDTTAQTITFTVGTYSVSCASSQAGNNKTISALTGTLTCPNYDSFCIQSRKICKNWCNQNGFCTNGVCNCYTGFSGEDCSKTICASNQFYISSTGLCSTTCLSGTYQNIYSRSCLPCASTCSECSGYPDACTACQSSISNPQVYYNGNCYSNCPSNTYQISDQCHDCDATVNCKTCNMTDTNCTSCLNGLFLENPTSGSCGSTCPNPTYSLKDVVNYLCVDTCTSNLVLVGATCTLCPSGQFKWISDGACHASCQPKYYQNTPNRFCQQCDSSCLQCDGQYAQNCTSCASNTPLKYLLLKMCVSTCPAGFYPNDVSGACQICTIGLNCATCQLILINNVSSVVCVTCNYGYYYQVNQTCTTGCDQYFYQNTWNHSCDSCSLNCGDCTSPYDSSCINCRGGKYFLSNMTGGYCLPICPTQYYVQTSTSCLSCHSTCLECNGVTSSDCSKCASGLYLYNGYCRYVCPQFTYPDLASLQCKPCDGNCNFCFGSTVDNCTSCTGTLVLNNFTCQSSCPSGMLENSWGVCEKYQLFLKFFFIGSLLIMLVMVS